MIEDKSTVTGFASTQPVGQIAAFADATFHSPQKQSLPDTAQNLRRLIQGGNHLSFKVTQTEMVDLENVALKDGSQVSEELLAATLPVIEQLFQDENLALHDLLIYSRRGAPITRDPERVFLHELDLVDENGIIHPAISQIVRNALSFKGRDISYAYPVDYFDEVATIIRFIRQKFKNEMMGQFKLVDVVDRVAPNGGMALEKRGDQPYLLLTPLGGFEVANDLVFNRDVSFETLLSDLDLTRIKGGDESGCHQIYQIGRTALGRTLPPVSLQTRNRKESVNHQEMERAQSVVRRYFHKYQLLGPGQRPINRFH